MFVVEGCAQATAVPRLFGGLALRKAKVLQSCKQHESCLLHTLNVPAVLKQHESCLSRILRVAALSEGHASVCTHPRSHTETQR